jgi:hypothetical protein
MYQLTDSRNNLILCWTPRCACTSTKAWWRTLCGNKEITDIEALHIETPVDIIDWDSFLKTEKRIIVVRNPIDRLVSLLNHGVVFQLVDSPGMERIDELLAVLQKTDLTSYSHEHFHHHANLQCCIYDKNKMHEQVDISSFFTHIIKLENGDISKQLNSIVDCGKELYLNKTENNSFSVSGKKRISEEYDAPQKEFSVINVPVIKRTDLTEQHIAQIKDLYYWDFKWFYPEALDA